MIIQNDQQNDTEYLCNTCNELVVSPICPFCLAEEIEAWLTLYPNLKEQLIPRIHDFLEDVSNHIDNYGTTCIKCDEVSAHVCTYCFNNFIFDELQEINAPHTIQKEFFEFFNYSKPTHFIEKENEKEGWVTPN
tara:strand:+ start:589 stop:990 length:402 start_codon:yes stop_codon:yes gene_type:complete